MARQFRVLVLNQISANGLKRLPAEHYIAGKDATDGHSRHSQGHSSRRRGHQ